MKKYKCINNQIFCFENYKIIPIRQNDRYDIMRWRNNQTFHLRQDVMLTKESQDIYYKEVVSNLFKESYPKQILFSYIHNNTCVGYGGLVNISWTNKNAEMSFVLDDKRINEKIKYEKEFTIFIKLILKLGFEEIKLNKIFTETYDLRPHHISILESNGFVIEGRMKEHIFIDGEYYDSLIHAYNNKDYLN